MGIWWVLSRGLALTLVMGFIQMATAQPLWKSLSRDENRLLQELKKETLIYLDKERGQGALQAQCFNEYRQTCPSGLEPDMALTRELLIKANQRYRLLAGLANRGAPSRILQPIVGLPRVVLENHGPDSELLQIFKVRREDRQAMKAAWELEKGNLIKDWHGHLAQEQHQKGFLAQEQHEIQKIYFKSLATLINTVPQVIFINRRHPQTQDFAKAYLAYSQQAAKAHGKASKRTGKKLLDFLFFRPVVKKYLQENPSQVSIYDELVEKYNQDQAKAMSLKKLATPAFLGIVGCSIVGYFVNPLIVALCRGVSLAMGTHSLATYWGDYRDTIPLWISGLGSYQQMESSRSQFAYSAILTGFLSVNFGYGLRNSIQYVRSHRNLIQSSVNSLRQNVSSQKQSTFKRIVTTQTRRRGRDVAAEKMVVIPDSLQMEASLTPIAIHDMGLSLLVVSTPLLTYSTLMQVKYLAAGL